MHELKDQGVPIILISHTLPDVFAVTDRIVVLQKGRIVEVGPHAELLARNGVYAQLHRIQFEWNETVSENEEATESPDKVDSTRSAG